MQENRIGDASRVNDHRDPRERGPPATKVLATAMGTGPSVSSCPRRGFVEAGAAVVRVLADRAEAKLKGFEVTDPRALELRAKIQVGQKRLDVARA